MSKGNKALRESAWVLAGISLLLSSPLSQAATAGVDQWFDQWEVVTDANTGAAGRISGCPTAQGATCTELTAGNGFLQQNVTISNIQYVQTIITDPNASGQPAALAYSDESFIQLNAATGIASLQRVSKDAAYQTANNAATPLIAGFVSSSSILSGWAHPTLVNGSTQTLSQEFVDAGGTEGGDEYRNQFRLGIDQNAGVVQGKSLSLRQDVEMGNGTVANSTDVQSFLIEGRSGSAYLPNAGSLTLAAPPAGATDNSGTVTWATADDVMVAWIGQQVNVADAGAAQSLSKFGFESIRNQTTLDAGGTGGEASTFSTDASDIVSDGAGGYVLPFDWNTSFGATPPTLPTAIAQ